MADRLSSAQRSYCMSRIKGKNTGLEKLVFSELRRAGIRYRKHMKTLPGRPDVVIAGSKLAVFIDGDFWHGYRFPLWRSQLKPFWQNKIEKNRRRDRRNFAALRRKGWKVIRLWGHTIKEQPELILKKIEEMEIKNPL